MILFNELRITPDGKFLIIDVAVEDIVAYKDIYIKYIKIDSLDTFISAFEPSNNPIYSYDVPTPEQEVYEENDPGTNLVLEEETNLNVYIEEIGAKKVRLKLKVSDFTSITSLKNTMFFIYVILNVNSECGVDTIKKLCTAVYLYPMYKYIMLHIRELDSNCNIPKGLIDAILRFQSIEASIKAGNYDMAIKYWKKFFIEDNSKVVTSNTCGCYGQS